MLSLRQKLTLTTKAIIVLKNSFKQGQVNQQAFVCLYKQKNTLIQKKESIRSKTDEDRWQEKNIRRNQ